MTIEDRLTQEARRLRAETDAAVDPASALTHPATKPPRSRVRAVPVMVAAAVVIAALVGIGLAVTDDDGERIVADQGETTTPTSGPDPDTSDRDTPGPVTVPATTPDIAGQVLAQSPAEPVGAMTFIGVEDALIDEWAGAGADGPAPRVDFDRHAVVTYTVSMAARCRGPVSGFDLDDATLRPHIAADANHECVQSTFPHEFFLAVDRADLPAVFDLVLDADLLDGDGPYTLRVDTSENFASFTPEPVQPGSSGLPAPDGPDLADAEPGREITFDRIGDVALGQEFGPSEFDRHFESGCGYWGPGEPSHDGDEPLGGLVAIDGDVGRAISVMVRDNPRYRTASGVGVGTTLATLERIYGDDLVVDRADGWESPTDGLLGSYVDVAAVRNGDRALTYYLHGDAVHTVKLSAADFWGDDEGCA